MTEDTAVVADGRCEFFIARKQRRCGMMCKKGAVLCTEHLNGERGPGNGNGNGSGKKDVRVPCPLDPKHTVWESNLQKHLKKCNKIKLRHLNDDKAFYETNINSAGTCKEQEIVSRDSEEMNALILECIPVLRELYNKHFTEEVKLDIRTNEFMANARYSQVVSNKKHAIQQSSLIQHLIDRKMTEKTSFVEFGCGRAELSRYINQVVTYGYREVGHSQHFILVDRASNRMKFDKKIVDDYQELTHTLEHQPHQLTHRYRIDIKDLKLDAVLKEEDDYVAVSKHLCGVATDLTLRCISKSSKLIQDGHLRGVCIAMCCRHVCDADEYVNPDYIKELLVGGEIDYRSFFGVLRKMCSWATCGRRPGVEDGDTNEHFTKLAVKERETLGFMARRIIDNGRLQWVDSVLPKGYEVELVRYVGLDVSLENVAMLISRKT